MNLRRVTIVLVAGMLLQGCLPALYRKECVGDNCRTTVLGF